MADNRLIIGAPLICLSIPY